RSFPYLNGYLQCSRRDGGTTSGGIPILAMRENHQRMGIITHQQIRRAEFRAPNRRDCTSLSGRKVCVATPDRLDWPKGGGLVEVGSAEQHPRNRGHVERANYLRRGAVRQGAVPPVVDPRSRRGFVEGSLEGPQHRLAHLA